MFSKVNVTGGGSLSLLTYSLSITMMNWGGGDVPFGCKTAEVDTFNENCNENPGNNFVILRGLCPGMRCLMVSILKGLTKRL